MTLNENKVFFNPGDRVIVRHSLDNRPEMYVVEKMVKTFKNKESIESVFTGIKCRWFNTNQELQEAVFSTKDLIHINER